MKQQQLNFDEVFAFMKEFKVDYLNRFGEFIIDEKTNTYVSIKGCESMDELKMRVVYALSRPIGKGLETKDAKRLLKRLNNYFDTELTIEDMNLLYEKLCYTEKLMDFEAFVKRGLPVNELKSDAV